jgi:hypothetical protein
MLPKRLIEEVSKKFRSKKFQKIHHDLKQGMVVLDIGVWANFPEPHSSENWLEKQNPGSGFIIAIGLENMTEFNKKYSHTICVQANGCALPFGNRSVDIAVSNAVLEHIPETSQPDFAHEISRVSCAYSILYVPDRFCPIEIHSRIFLLHWLKNWRRWFALLGEKYWSRYENLSTIFTKKSLEQYLRNADAPGIWSVNRLKFLGIPISLVAKFIPNNKRGV